MKRMSVMIMLTLLLLVLASGVAAQEIVVNNGNAIIIGDDTLRRSNPEDDSITRRIQQVTTVVDLLVNTTGNPLSAQFTPAGRFSAQTLNASFEFLADNRLSMTFTVPADLHAVDTQGDSIAELVGSLIVTDGSVASNPVDVRMQAENTLVFDRIEVVVDGISYRCRVTRDNDCDRDLLEIMPGADIRMDVTLRNLYRDDTNLDFDDVVLNIRTTNRDIEPLDDREFLDIRTQDREEIRIDFRVDSRVEDGDRATITLEMVGLDLNGARHGARYTIDMRFELPAGLVEVQIFNLLPNRVCPGDMVSGTFTIANVGRDRQRNVRVQVESLNLDFTQLFTGIDLEDARRTRNINDFSESFSFRVPDNQRSGTYAVRTTVFYQDDNRRDTSAFRDVQLIVEDCRPPEPTPQPTPQPTPPTNDREDSDLTVVPPTTGIGGDVVTARPIPPRQEQDETMIVTILTVLVIIMGLLVGYLILVLARRR